MKVSTTQPFQIIYSLFAHEYLGDLFESFVVQIDSRGRLTYLHQNISAKNASEFAKGLDETDYKLIELMDSIQQDVVAHKFHKKKINANDFFLKIYDKDKGDEMVQKAIVSYVDHRMSMILPLLVGKHVYTMGNDGDPAGKKVEVSPTPATALFHFFKNEDNTHYFPTIKHNGEKVDFQYNGSQILCNEPAWLLIREDKIITFKKELNGKKLKPFLNKKFINIPQKVEDAYYKNFITQLVADFDVHAEGFTINTEEYDAIPALTFKELLDTDATPSLFDEDKDEVDMSGDGKLVFDLSFGYGPYRFNAGSKANNSVKLEKKDASYIFHKIKRNLEWEHQQIGLFQERGMDIRNGKVTMPKAEAFQWLSDYEQELRDLGYAIAQHAADKKKYYMGKSSINIEVRENNDWFDIYAVVKFGDFEIPFLKLKNMILAKQREFELPNGEIAVIPEAWLVDYSELFAFSDENDGDSLKLEKLHLSLVHELSEDGGAKVTMSKKLENLRDFETIEDYDLPVNFNGTLRPYQKAGYNWMKFLNSYNFGGCLADDMGLGKTVQTLALLQKQKEEGAVNASLLIMPTSLVYNWENEAAKFTPDLKILVYTGTYRDKNVEQFEGYDIIITTYGIVRLDISILEKYYFNYIILDESQTIKNPNSNIAQAVNDLKSRHKLVLSGTPIENSTMDLWSQMSFVNGGLLGSQTFFKNTFQLPIEKRSDVAKKKKLYTIIKPFILRRTKSQVLTELPEKIEQVYYCGMSDEQEKKYEETKSFYRNKILDEIDTNGIGKSQIVLLQGLTKLRQIANHPQLVEEDYAEDSGKMNDVLRMLQNAIDKGHKILIFSQFVKHLAIFKKYLKEQKMDFAYLDGATKDRQAQVEKFQNNEDLRIFLISLKAGGLGLNLTAADYVFILDPWWNPAIESQAVDRAYRMGQKNTVHTYKFITKNTVEEKILKLQNAKKQLADELISTEDSFVKSLSKEDIEDILS